MSGTKNIDNWQKERDALRKDLRVLIVDGDQNSRKKQEDLLFQQRIPARSVSSGEQALELADRENYALAIIADVLPQMHGVSLSRVLREKDPNLGLIITTEKATLRLIDQAFELEIAGIVEKPLTELMFTNLRALVNKTLDRQAGRLMRSKILNSIRQTLIHGGKAGDLKSTRLHARLSGFKRHLGDFNKVLVVENDDSNLRLFSEHLMLKGLAVESIEHHDRAVKRLEHGGINLLVTPLSEKHAAKQFNELHKLLHTHQFLELVFVASKPNIEHAMTLLHQGISSYIPWPPTSLSRLADRISEILKREKQERLVDNLFVELFRENSLTSRAFKEELKQFREIVSLRYVELRYPALAPPSSTTNIDLLLADFLQNPDAEKKRDRAHNRRRHERVEQHQFIRYRRKGKESFILGHMSDISESGLFIQTLQRPSTESLLQLDFNVECENAPYRVMVNGKVSRIAVDGFGVAFVDPPDDVLALLRQIIMTK